MLIRFWWCDGGDHGWDGEELVIAFGRDAGWWRAGLGIWRRDSAGECWLGAVV